MRFQQRDGQILLTVQRYDGLLGRRHLKQFFWQDATLRAAQKRLAKLVKGGYLARPTPEQRRTQPIPEPVYWLGWKGILWIAAQRNARVSAPTNQGENQMRRLAKGLRDQGIRWLREPRWLQITHDLAVVDFRLAVEQAVCDLPQLHLEEWRHESQFRAAGDTIRYSFRDTKGRVRYAERQVYPDSYFVILDQRRLASGLLARARLLLELDNATHSNPRFGRQKVKPGIAYIKSAEYRARFGKNSGRWLIVTTGERRMRNLMRQTALVAGGDAAVFLFTTFDKLHAGNLLVQPIWYQLGQTQPVPLMA